MMRQLIQNYKKKEKISNHHLLLLDKLNLHCLILKLYQKLYKTEDEIQNLLDSIRDEFAAIIPPDIINSKMVFSYI